MRESQCHREEATNPRAIPTPYIKGLSRLFFALVAVMIPPLRGIGLVHSVNGHTRFLHDGRARNISEAILWHGGEGGPARQFFLNMSRDERDSLLRFLESL